MGSKNHPLISSQKAIEEKVIETIKLEMNERQK